MACREQTVIIKHCDRKNESRRFGQLVICPRSRNDCPW